MSDPGMERGASFFDDLAERPLQGTLRLPADNARSTATGEPHPPQENAPAGEYAREVNLIRARRDPEPIAWLWNGWLCGLAPVGVRQG